MRDTFALQGACRDKNGTWLAAMLAHAAALQSDLHRLSTMPCAQGTGRDGRRYVRGGAAGARCCAAGAPRARRCGCARRAAGYGGFSACACVSRSPLVLGVRSGPRSAACRAKGQVLCFCALKACSLFAVALACSYWEATPIPILHLRAQCRLGLCLPAFYACHGLFSHASTNLD